MPKYIW